MNEENQHQATSKTEKPKRLAPKREVLRELYLRSGNECAFPGCAARLVDSEGKFVAQLCHIEGVGPISARFNSKQTNEQRRTRENLLLMCYTHHVATNDESVYTVTRMKEIKREHEACFSDVVGAIQKSIVDITAKNNLMKAQSLAKMGVQALELNAEQLVEETLAEFHRFSERLAQLPPAVRELMIIIARRAKRPPGINMSRELTIHEIQQATGLGNTELHGHLEILDKYGFIREGFQTDSGQSTIEVLNLKSSWPIWQELLMACETYHIRAEDVVVKLNFRLLD